MAFDLVQAGGYGAGTIDWEYSAGSINSVGYVTSISADNNTTTIDINVFDDSADLSYIDQASQSTVAVGTDFEKGVEVLLLVTGGDSHADSAGQAVIKQYEGIWAVAKITATSGRKGDAARTLTLDRALPEFAALSSYLPAAPLSIVVVTIPHFRNLTIGQGAVLEPIQGYPLAFKCSGTLTLNGGHIDLRNKGNDISVTPHYNTAQEAAGILDTDKYSGWENSQTKDRLMMNCDDGTCFIIAKKIVVADSTSRIGNPTTSGAQFYRGATDSRVYDGTKPANVTNIGGSTILLVAGTIEGFVPDIIAKYRSLTTSEISSGVYTDVYNGLARCYIASNTKLRNDEGLYAYDCISDSSRVSSTLNVRSFGDGSDGTSNNYTGQLNNYLAVTARDSSGKVFTYTNKTGTGLALFKIGALVMIHYRHKQTTTFNFSGEFILAHVLGITDNEITVDTKITLHTLSDYDIQLITIPQFTNYTLSVTNSATPAYSNGMGGIFAIAVNGTCDISGGVINVEGKGGVNAYGRNGLARIGNAQDCDKLPIGNGHGSVFILAKNLIMNSSTRIGATYSGAVTGSGYFGGGCSNYAVGRIVTGHGGGYSASCANDCPNGGGWGGGGGFNKSDGGYGSSGKNSYSNTAGLQGAHVMIIADKITGFNQAAISTGGGGAGANLRNTVGEPGSAGYGGGGTGEPENSTSSTAYSYSGGYNGGGAGGAAWDDYSDSETPEFKPLGGGGASGWAFIYCNTVVSQDTTDTVYM